MSDATYPLYPICAFTGFVLVTIPLPSHIKAWNAATAWFMIWTALACLNQFVNAVVWHGNVINRAPVWCDISVRIALCAQVGIPASCLAINRRLFAFTHLKVVSVSRSMKIREAAIDTAICLLIPLICIPMAYVVEGHRFDIFEDIGCFMVIYNTLPAYFLVFTPPVLLGFVSLVFGMLTLISFAKRRAEVTEFATSGSGMTMSRYFRLMAMALTEMCLNMPLGILAIILNSRSPIQPWISWEDTHFDYGRVDLIPAVIWRDGSLIEAELEFTRWVIPFCAFIFFAFFGLSDDARKRYKAILRSVDRRIRVSKILPRGRSRLEPLLSRPTTKATLPLHTRHCVLKRPNTPSLALSYKGEGVILPSNKNVVILDELPLRADYCDTAVSFPSPSATEFGTVSCSAASSPSTPLPSPHRPHSPVV